MLKLFYLIQPRCLLILKFNEKFISKQTCLDKYYKRGFSTSKCYYTDFNMTLLVEYEILRPLTILIHLGSPNDAKIFDGMVSGLKRRRLIGKGQLLIADKGFYCTYNYLIRINKYKIVPLIFPEKNPSMELLKDKN